MQRRSVLGILFVVLGLSGCQGLFEANVLAGLDVPTLPPADQLSSAGVEEIRDLLNSKKTLDLIKTDSHAREALSANLESVMASGTPAEKVDAAKVYLDLQLNGTGALDATNALVTELLPVLSGNSTETWNFTDPASDPAAFQSVLQDIFGSDPASVAATLEGLQNMVAGYRTLEENGSMDNLPGDHLVAAPLAVLADILVTASSPDILAAFITGQSDTLEGFDVEKVETGFSDLQTVVTGGESAAATDYAFLAALTGDLL